jgi:hypothetical protein
MVLPLKIGSGVISIQPHLLSILSIISIAFSTKAIIDGTGERVKLVPASTAVIRPENKENGQDQCPARYLTETDFSQAVDGG